MDQGPKWTSTSIRPINGEDHLGIRFVAISIADILQSGITSITPRARYWAFFSWVLFEFIENSPQEKSTKNFKQFLKKQEWFYILANILEAKENGISTNALIGSTKGSTILENDRLSYDLHLDYVKDSYGGYGTYRNVMKILGLTREADANKGVEIDRLTPLGKKLAEAFELTISATEYYQKYRQTDQAVPKNVLLEYGKVASLSKINESTSKDRSLLLDIFLPTEPKGERSEMRKSSLLYYMNLIQQSPGTKFSFQQWQNVMYDRFYYKEVTIPSKLQAVAIGWEIYHARQLFTYSLDTIWSYMLSKLSKSICTKYELISTILRELEKNQIDLSEQVSKIEASLPLQVDERREYINKMGSKERKHVVTDVWKPILVMLDVKQRLMDRKDFAESHQELLRLGGKGSISFKSWSMIVKQYEQKTMKQLIEYILNYLILEQHQKVALNKLITTKNETYHFVENNGKLYFIHDDHPVFNTFRVHQGLSILEDLGLIKQAKGTYMITPAGQVKMNE